MEDSARVVSLTFLVVVLWVPDGDNSLPCVAIVLQFLDRVVVLAIGSATVRAVEYPIVLGIVLKLRADGNDCLWRAYTAKKLASLNGTDAGDSATADADRQSGEDIIDVDNCVFYFKRIESSRRGRLPVAQHVIDKINVAVDAIFDMNKLYGSIQCVYLSSLL